MPRRMSTRWAAVWMLLVRAVTRMAGVPIGCSRNSLLWHWMRSIFNIGCLAIAFGLVAVTPARPEHPAPVSKRPAKAPAATQTKPAIVAFGDSLTAGYGAEPGNSYPDF